MNDEEKDTAIVVLQDHYAKNRLEIEEFERRVEIAERAASKRDLERALDGLPIVAELVPVHVTPAVVRATLASISRRGRWRLPARVDVKATLGAVDLDLTQAEIARGDTVIAVSATFGSVTITVADDLEVECEGTAFAGSFEHMGQRARSKKDARRVKIVGRALFGSVDIVVRKRPPASFLEEVKDGVRALLTGRS